MFLTDSYFRPPHGLLIFGIFSLFLAAVGTCTEKRLEGLELAVEKPEEDGGAGPDDGCKRKDEPWSCGG